jgi:sarcosine oxidase gamma subunit
MTELAFLSPHRADSDAIWRSPLERALAYAPAGIEDISRIGKVEVRGDIDALDVDAEVVRITPARAIVLGDVESILARAGDAFFAVDVSAGYAGLRVRGQQLLRRLTDLDLDNLPAVGSVHHVQTLVIRDDDETFRLFFPQEYGDYVAELGIDAAEGLSS